MQLAVTFRHMNTSPAIKDYAKEKVDRITKYLPDPIKAHIVLSCDRGYHHIADVVITLHNGIVIKGEEVTEDMYSSIDLVMAKIERQVRKYKEKIRDHRPNNHPEIEVRHSVVEVHGEAPIREGDGGRDSDPALPIAAAATPDRPRIIRESKIFARPLNLDEAVMQMNLLNNDFLVFTSAETRQVNVIYRRGDGSYGLIETGSAAVAAAS